MALRTLPAVSRQPASFFRFACWLTIFVFVGASVFLPRAEARLTPDRSLAQGETISQSATLPSALVSTHTFVAKPNSVSVPSSGLDVPLFSSAPRQRFIYAGNSHAQRTLALHGARHTRPTLVGVVEFRL